MKKTRHISPVVGSFNMADGGVSSFITITQAIKGSNQSWWRWGSDNLLPNALAMLNRRSSVQRSILNSKTTYCTGKKFLTDNKDFENYIKSVNINGESLRKVYGQLLYDDFSQGNAFIEIVKDKKNKFIFIYRHDPLTCRIGKKSDDGRVLLSADWNNITNKIPQIKRISLYPNFTDVDGYLRSIYHVKNDEQGFQNYGVPSYIAGLQGAAIAYKTDKWNLSRIDNSFNSSGVITVEDEFESDEQAEELKKAIEKKYTGEGTQGRIMVVVKGINDGTTTFTPFDTNNEGDWKELHSQAKDDLIIAHEWYRSLTSMPDNTGFDTKRILNEYQIALNTTITKMQQNYIELFQKLLQYNFDVEKLAIENQPPINILTMLDANAYVKIGEARKMAGLDVDENDPAMNEFVKSNIKNEQDNNSQRGNQ